MCTDTSITIGHMPSAQDEQSRHWSGTSFDLGFDYSSIPGLQSGVYQRERCPKTGREHIQFYFEFSRRLRFSQVRKMLPGAHVERCRNIEASRKYASKEESRIAGPFLIGQDRKRKSTVDVLSQLKSSRVTDVLDDNPHLWRSVQCMQRVSVVYLNLNKRSERTFLCYVYGDTGCGKTYMMHRFMSVSRVYWHNGSQWWDNYAQEPIVVVDEYHGQFDHRLVLRLGDRTPMQVPIKGGFVEFNSFMVVFLSNLPPEQTLFLHHSDSVINAMKRRFSIIRYDQ